MEIAYFNICTFRLSMWVWFSANYGSIQHELEDCKQFSEM